MVPSRSAAGTDPLSPQPLAPPDPVAHGEDRGLDAILKAELGEQVGDAGLDRHGADQELGGDRGVSSPLREQPHDLALALRQRRRIMINARRGSRAALDIRTRGP
jgi:hypothetical protein